MAGRFEADGVHAGIGAAVSGHVAQDVDDTVDFFEVDRFRAALLREFEAFGDAIDGDDAFGSEHERAANRELRDGTATPDGDGVAPLNIAIDGTHVAGWE